MSSRALSSLESCVGVGLGAVAGWVDVGAAGQKEAVDAVEGLVERGCGAWEEQEVRGAPRGEGLQVAPGLLLR